MDNWLIFQYHHNVRPLQDGLLREAFGPTDPPMAESNGVTEGG